MLVGLIFLISSEKLSCVTNVLVMRQSACLFINPITVDSFASLFNCTLVGRAFNDGPNTKLVDFFGLDLVLAQLEVFFLLRYFSGIVSHPGVLRVSQYVSVESSSLTHHRPYS